MKTVHVALLLIVIGVVIAVSTLFLPSTKRDSIKRGSIAPETQLSASVVVDRNNHIIVTLRNHGASQADILKPGSSFFWGSISLNFKAIKDGKSWELWREGAYSRDRAYPKQLAPGEGISFEIDLQNPSWPAVARLEKIQEFCEPAELWLRWSPSKAALKEVPSLKDETVLSPPVPVGIAFKGLR